MSLEQEMWNLGVSHWAGFIVRERRRSSSYRAEIVEVERGGVCLLAEVVEEGNEYRFFVESGQGRPMRTQIGRSFRSRRAAERFARGWVRRLFLRNGGLRWWSRFAAVAVASVAGVLSVLIVAAALFGPRVNERSYMFSPAVASTQYAPVRKPVGELGPALVPSVGKINPRADLEPRLEVVEQQAVKAVAAALGISAAQALAPDAWFVLADPLCPYCRSFEPVLDELPSAVRPVVIPVGVRSELSTALVESFFELTGDDDRKKADVWREFMDPSFDEERARQFIAQNPPSSESKKKAFATASLFSSLRFKKTPTLISPDWRVSGLIDKAANLRLWLSGGVDGAGE